MALKRQISVVIPNRPGSLGRLCRALARNKVNIQAVDIGGTQEYGIVHLVVDNGPRARKALDRAKYDYSTEPVVVVTLPDRPGTLARFGRAIAAKKVNIDYIYGSSAKGVSLLVARVSDPRKANAAARRLLRQLRAR
ncbi:MAG: ACT domain-containing protein [Gemmatimonadetes bacterium]|nr:ACT domain-containing protein [Gemmatimonadota bacterium]